MPKDINSVSLYPSVPVAPGVPPLLRTLSNVVSTVSLVVSNINSLLGYFLGPQWGIFDADNNLVIAAEVVVDIDFSKDYKNATYPMEDGTFASYNKVETPYEGKIVFAQGASLDDRTGFLAEIDQVIATLELYTVVTPEAVYENANITHYSYRREARRGAFVLLVDVRFQEIRNIDATAFAPGTADTSSMPTQDNGTTQPTDPTPIQNATQNNIDKKSTGLTPSSSSNTGFRTENAGGTAPVQSPPTGFRTENAGLAYPVFPAFGTSPNYVVP